MKTKLNGQTIFLQNVLKCQLNVIDCHLTNTVNNDISSNKYSKHEKPATIRLIFKKDDRANIKNHCP